MTNSIAQATSKVGDLIIKNSPTLLTVCGGIGLVTTAVMASKTTLKAQDILSDAMHIKTMPKDQKITTVKNLAKLYTPTLIVGGMSLACIFGSNHINIRRNAALATAYTFTTRMAQEYQDKVIETIGKKKEQKIQEEVQADRIKNKPETIVISDEEGMTLCYDSFTGRYFKSDIETIRRAMNDVNALLNEDGFVALNEFYDRLGLPNAKLGEDLGWNSMYEGQMDLKYSSQLTDKKTPCLVIEYNVEPREYFDRTF